MSSLDNFLSMCKLINIILVLGLFSYLLYAEEFSV